MTSVQSLDDIPATMKAGVIEEWKKSMKLETQHPIPKNLEGYDILVEIKAAGMCHTDVQTLEGVYESQGTFKGMIGSHEPAGVVIALGPEAKKQGLVNVGDRVGSINTYGYCGKCKSCKKNGEQLCENIKGLLGLTIDGGFAEYCKMDSRVVGKIPKEIPFTEAAPLFCAGATVYGAIKAAGVEANQWIAIVGAGGGLGHLGVQYAKALGFKVVALDNRQEGLDVLNSIPDHLKPDQKYLLTDENIEKLSSSFYDSDPGVDKAIICAEDRSLPRITQQFLRKGGIICDVGLPADGPLEVDSFALSFKEQTIRGRLICTPHECQEMVNMHARSGCKTYVEQTFPIEKIQDVYDRYNQKDLKGRIVVSFE